MAKAQIQKVNIRHATESDLRALWALSQELRQIKEPDYFDQQLANQAEGGRDVYIASLDGRDVAYCILNWKPKYGYFKAMNIPEIQDLNVVLGYRQRGIATQMIAYCEGLIAKAHELAGISFALHPGAGPAQKLYVKLGYQPDGFGVTYDRKTVGEGEFKPVDDNLCLMMVKKLK